MARAFNVLIIEEHPITIETYKRALLDLNSTLNNAVFKICTATSYELAMKKMVQAVEQGKYQLIFLDIKVATVANGKMLTCEEKGQIIRQFFKDVKIIVSTTISDNYRINKIFSKVKPDAFLIKEDFSFNDLKDAIESVLDNAHYYSKTVMKLIHKKISNDVYLDEIDRAMLSELNKGTKMRDLPNILPLSLGGVEKRKRQLKKKLDIEKEEDRVLIELAKEYGFV